jgi:hypothetical protein
VAKGTKKAAVRAEGIRRNQQALNAPSEAPLYAGKNRKQRLKRRIARGGF